MSHRHKGLERVHRVIVIAVDHQEFLIAHEGGGREYGVRRASRCLLHRIGDAKATRRNDAGVSVSEPVVFRADDETYLNAAGVSEPRQDVVEERPASNRHERLHAGARHRILIGGESRGLVLGLHPRAQTAGQNHSFQGYLGKPAF